MDTGWVDLTGVQRCCLAVGRHWRPDPMIEATTRAVALTSHTRSAATGTVRTRPT